MGGLHKWFRFLYCIFEFWIDKASVIVHYCCFLTGKGWVLSMLGPPKDPRNISAVKTESEPWWRGFHSCWLETKMLLVLSHDADGQLACCPAALEAGDLETMIWADSGTPSLTVQLALVTTTRPIYTYSLWSKFTPLTQQYTSCSHVSRSLYAIYDAMRHLWSAHAL